MGQLAHADGGPLSAPPATFPNHIHPDDMYDEEKSRIVHFIPDVGSIEWPEPDLPKSAEAFNEELCAFFGAYLWFLSACWDVKKVFKPFVTDTLHRDSAFPDTHALVKMFDEFEIKMGHPFQKMKWAVLHTGRKRIMTVR